MTVVTKETAVMLLDEVAATATTTTSNANRRSGGGNSRNFTYALAVVSLLVFLLVVCYAIWTLSIETILPVVTESNKNLEDLRPNNLPPLLGNNVTGNWFSVYVEITTASSVQVENPYASETISIVDSRRHRKRFRGRFNRRFYRKFHRRFGHQRKRAETKDRTSNTLNGSRIDDRYKGIQGDGEVQPEQNNKEEKDDEVIIVKGGLEVGVEDKGSLWEEYKSQHYPPKHPLISTTSLTDLEDVRWVKCDGGERRNNLDGTGDNLVERGDNQEESRNNLEERSGNLVEKRDNLVERRLKSIQRRRKPIKINKLNGYNLGEDFLSEKYPKNVSYSVHYSGNEKSSVHDGIHLGGESGNGSEDDNDYGIGQEGKNKVGLSFGVNVEDEENKNTVKEETNGKKRENKGDGDNDYDYYEKDGEKKTETETVFGFNAKKENRNMKSGYDRAEVEANSINPERDLRKAEYFDKVHDNEETDWKSELKRLLEESNRHEERQQQVQRKSGHNEHRDSCGQWIQCKYHSLRRYLKQLENLPSCPCVFPNLMWHNQLWDEQRESYFTWEIASSPAERRDIYRPGAKFCIRSLLEPGMITLAVQHCCYDVKQRLITRGRAAGTPNLISPQISWELHKKVDILPWVLCKGDWLRYHQMVPPNNAVKCEENPKDREFYNQIMDLRNI
ncbi:uncharacterized protein LOC106869716 [Octopus bimaculoides]|nr:uncharacterized protein LOC106869716 [Octopus bimaculoides]|eukprot:XP_014771047.1 PREDICTED: uncharacterized protein LOC106869716 [Octopus bimaculoides]